MHPLLINHNGLHLPPRPTAPLPDPLLPSKSFHEKTNPGKTPAHMKGETPGRRRGGGEAALPEDPVMKQEGGRAVGSCGRCLLRAGSPRRWERVAALFLLFPKETGPGALCPPGAGKEKGGGRVAAASPRTGYPLVAVFQTTASPSLLQPSS